MAKAPIVNEDVPAEVAVSRSLSVEDLRAIAKAASDVAGYFGGSTYEQEKNAGIEVLNSFGITFTEAN